MSERSLSALSTSLEPAIEHRKPPPCPNDHLRRSCSSVTERPAKRPILMNPVLFQQVTQFFRSKSLSARSFNPSRAALQLPSVTESYTSETSPSIQENEATPTDVIPFTPSKKPTTVDAELVSLSLSPKSTFELSPTTPCEPPGLLFEPTSPSSPLERSIPGRRSRRRLIALSLITFPSCSDGFVSSESLVSLTSSTAPDTPVTSPELSLELSPSQKSLVISTETLLTNNHNPLNALIEDEEIFPEQLCFSVIDPPEPIAYQSAGRPRAISEAECLALFPFTSFPSPSALSILLSPPPTQSPLPAPTKEHPHLRPLLLPDLVAQRPSHMFNSTSSSSWSSVSSVISSGREESLFTSRPFSPAVADSTSATSLLQGQRRRSTEHRLTTSIPHGEGCGCHRAAHMPPSLPQLADFNEIRDQHMMCPDVSPTRNHCRPGSIQRFARKLKLFFLRVFGCFSHKGNVTAEWEEPASTSNALDVSNPRGN